MIYTYYGCCQMIDHYTDRLKAETDREGINIILHALVRYENWLKELK